MTDRLTVNTITSDALDALYDRAEQAERSAKAWETTARQYAGNADYWRNRAERAEAALDRVRAAVNALCHEPHPSHDHVCPDHIAAVVQAALNAEQVDPAEPAPAPVEPATPLPAPPPTEAAQTAHRLQTITRRDHGAAGPDHPTEK